MEIDIPDDTNGSTAAEKENGFDFYPVSEMESGEGLPYAPIDWPNPGDIWGWKVGKRTSVHGYFMDRYLYLPSRLQGKRKRTSFASKLTIEEYIKTKFPATDLKAFYASFSWKIPSEKTFVLKGIKEGVTFFTGSSGKGVDSVSYTQHCKAGNPICRSIAEAEDGPSEASFCDICCSEPDFCRDCCCILCCKTIDLAHGGYNVISCESKVAEGLLCGHMAHIECGIRSYMAGTIGGSINLDVEYYCRRCDTRTDLLSHVTKLVQTCEAINSCDDIEKILNIGVRILRGSKKTSAKRLLHRIESAMAKLKNGSCVEDIWKVDDISATTTGEASHQENGSLEAADYDELQDCQKGSLQICSKKFDLRIESLKLENEIDQVLQELKKSQEYEYNIAEERLFAQKNYILNLYQQLDHEKTHLTRCTSSKKTNVANEAVLKRVDQIKREVTKLRDMEAVAKGFGNTSKEILKEHFGMEMQD